MRFLFEVLPEDLTDDFRVEVIYIDPIFIEKAIPNNNYGMRGSLSLA